MIKRSFTGSVLLVALAISISTGQTPSGEQPKVFTVPREYALPVIVYQPDCPLRVETLSYLGMVEGGGGLDYTMRHTGIKPIVSYRIAWLTSLDTSGELSFTAKAEADRIKPGDVIPKPGLSTTLTPLTDELRKKFKMDATMQAIVYLMVVRVEFADGTVYSDEQTHKALKFHIEKIANKMSQ